MMGTRSPHHVCDAVALSIHTRTHCTTPHHLTVGMRVLQNVESPSVGAADHGGADQLLGIAPPWSGGRQETDQRPAGVRAQGTESSAGIFGKGTRQGGKGGTSSAGCLDHTVKPDDGCTTGPWRKTCLQAAGAWRCRYNPTSRASTFRQIRALLVPPPSPTVVAMR